MAQGVTQAQRCPAEQKWCKSGLTVHREIYAKQLNVVLNMISKAKQDYIHLKKKKKKL